MFGISKLSSKKTQDTDDKYIPVSSMIEEGSALDRRKPRNNRRLNPDRRKLLNSFFVSEEKRSIKHRREISSRRASELQSTGTIDNIDELQLTTSNIQALIREQIFFIEGIDELSLSVKEMAFQGVQDKTQEYVDAVRSQVKKEQHFLRLYIDKDVKYYEGEEAGSSLSDFNTDIYDVSNQVLQLLEKYTVTKVKEENAGFFLMDMKILRDKVSHCLERKQNHLYPKYFRCL